MGLDIQAAQTIEEEIKSVLRFNNNHAHSPDLSIEEVQPYFEELTALIDMFNGVKALSFKDKELKALALSERLKMVTQFDVLRYAADRRYLTTVAADCDQVARLSTTTNHYRKEIQHLLTVAITPDIVHADYTTLKNETSKIVKPSQVEVAKLFTLPRKSNMQSDNMMGNKLIYTQSISSCG